MRNAALAILATTDGPTGIAAKRTLRERQAAELRTAQRTRAPLSLVLLDVDCARSTTMPSATWPGTRCWCRWRRYCAQAPERPIWRRATTGRSILLPNTPLAGARYVAERSRAAIAQTTFAHSAVTASFGVATAVEGGLAAKALIAAADAALYAAKRHGRNTVICAPAADGP